MDGATGSGGRRPRKLSGRRKPRAGLVGGGGGMGIVLAAGVARCGQCARFDGRWGTSEAVGDKTRDIEGFQADGMARGKHVRAMRPWSEHRRAGRGPAGRTSMVQESCSVERPS